MSIKPIDYVSIISKSQDVVKIKQEENNKVSVQFDQGIVQQEKKINHNFNRVRDTGKSELRMINKNDRNNKNHNKNQKDRKNNKNKKETDNNIDIKV